MMSDEGQEGLVGCGTFCPPAPPGARWPGSNGWGAGGEILMIDE